MNRLKAIKKPILDIIYFGFSARILGFIKGILIAFYIGANYSTDNYILAFTATTLLAKIIGDGLTTSLVPVLQQVDKRDGKKGRVELTNNAINSFFFFSFVLIIGGYILSPIIIKVLGPGFKGEDFKNTVHLFRIGLPIIGLVFIRAICAGYLQSDHRFKAGAKSNVVNNLIYIIYLIFFPTRFGLEGLMIAGIIAVVGQIVVLMKAMMKIGYKYEFVYNPKSRTLERLISFIFPISLSVGINEINIAIDNAVGSGLAGGTIAELNYANGIIELVIGLFVTAIVTAIFPVLSSSFNSQEPEQLKGDINFGINLLLIIFIPVAIILGTLSQPIIRLFYERGAFGSQATILTAGILKSYALGLVGMSLILFIIRAYYAIHDTITPVTLGIISLVSNLILTLILARYFDGKGIALGTSISVFITVCYGIYDLNNKLDFLSKDKIGWNLFKLFTAGTVMALVILLIKKTLGEVINNSIGGDLLLVLISIIVGTGIYAIICYNIIGGGRSDGKESSGKN